MSDKWYDKSIKQLEELLHTDIRGGLSQQSALDRVKKNGENVIYPIPKGPFRTYLKHILTDFTSITLALTAAIAAVLERSEAAAAMLVLLALNYGAAVFTYVKAQRVLESMGRFALPSAKVIRGGRLFLVRQEQLAVGDVMLVSAGDIVPCDARLVESDGLSALEVNLTGSPKAAPKDASFIEYRDIPPSEQKNMLFASAILTAGTGKAVVCAVAGETLICKMGKNRPIVSHDKLGAINYLKRFRGSWSLFMIAVIFALTVLDFVLGPGTRGLFDIFLTGLSLAVASMSELFAAFGYIVVACGIFSAQKRFRNVNSGALIKNSSKLETLKDITCLIVPKEGVFSIKNLRIERIYVNGAMHILPQDGPQAQRDRQRGEGPQSGPQSATQPQRSTQGARGGQKRVPQHGGRQKTEPQDWQQSVSSPFRLVLKYALISTALYGGKKLAANNVNYENIYTAEEEAIISAADRYSIYNVDLDRSFPILDHEGVTEDSLFETTLIYDSGDYAAAVRGEINRLLDRCGYLRENGRVKTLTDERRNEIKIAALLAAKETFRIVGVASNETVYNNLTRIGAIQSDMVFEGFLAIREPMLPLVAKNVSRLSAAGVKIIMLCSDISENNRYFAEAVGVIKDPSEIITAPELVHMKEGLARLNIASWRLYEGLNLTQKRLLMKWLREDGEVVGFLGRELDEIIMLRESDVSFSQAVTLSPSTGAQGIELTDLRAPVFTKSVKEISKNGCEAVKFVSDIIVSEADRRGSGGFNAITDAIASAKVVYLNLLRAVKYLISVQCARLFIVLYGIITRGENVTLTAPQILFSGLIVDFAAVVIIAFERPSSDIFRSYSANAPRTDTEEKLRRPLAGSLQSVLIGLFWAASVCSSEIVMNAMAIYPGRSELVTASFVGFVLGQIVTLSETIKERSVFIPNVKLNRIFALLIAFTAAFLASGLLFLPFGTVFDMSPMSPAAWCAALAEPAALLLVYEMYKIAVKKKA